MSKSRKIISILVSMILSLSILVVGYYAINKSSINTNNHCVLYVRNFLHSSPKSEILLNEIEEKTSEFLNNKTYEKGFYLSNFHKNYLKDIVLYGAEKSNRNLIKQQYFYEVIMLRMRVLAIQGNIEDHNKLFKKYIYDIEENINTRGQYLDAYLYDTNNLLEYNDELFILLEESYITAYQECENIKLKFILLNEIIEFYKDFDECSEQQVFYQNELNQLIKDNKDSLQAQLEQDYLLS